ncbi:ejaculatory bulb-specific protein 3 [Plodia interpunctella]|uniref:ejaculatory bulb-specific protein 3 n=1 Tax=Plodia interpunctella TaxID=58824 RepID=UPI002367590A|nr:ejaculatory bulb-specific protein 3-like [Plodia interpunctella]
MISITQVLHCSNRTLWWIVDSVFIKMKIAIYTISLALLGLCACDDTYTDRYDDIDVDEIVANRRLLTPYLKCILDEGRCTPEGKELKVHIKDAMQTACSKCTPVQKSKARKVVKHIQTNEEDYWKKLIAKYDPDNQYRSIYEAFLASDD